LFDPDGVPLADIPSDFAKLRRNFPREREGKIIISKKRFASPPPSSVHCYAGELRQSFEVPLNHLG
jgi:hypothetical protein